MKKYDIAVIGGGVIGCEIARRMTQQSQSVVVLEKSADVASYGGTKANSGIVHAGFDCKVGTLKARLNVRGSNLYPQLCKQLKVPLKNCGALVVGRKEDEEKIQNLAIQGEKNGVEGLSIVGREEIKNYIKNPADGIEIALLAKTSCVISPYLVAIAMAEEACINGCDFRFEFEVEKISKTEDGFEVFSGEDKIYCKTLINASGGNSAKINALAGAEEYGLSYARGEYMLLDLSEKDIVSATIFPLPTKLGKGVLCSPTAHGNIILGPTAISCETDETTITTQGLDFIRENISQMVDQVNLKKNIRVFSGVRSVCGDDFVIENSRLVEGYTYLVGICSPGLSSAPAISEYVQQLLENRHDFKPLENPKQREGYVETSHLTEEELNSLIKRDSSYGEIVCRCEKITRGEILQAVRSPLKPRTVDGVKRRVRAGMGRCQGGFCMPTVMEIIAEENGISMEEVTKFGKGSEICYPQEEN